MVTMKQIAEKAKVSQATVSRVINGHPSVSPELRRRVIEWVDKFGYQPNKVAQSLAKNESHLLGVVVPTVSNPYFSETILSIDETASYYGYNILLCNTKGSIQKEKEIIKILQSRKVDGILLAPTDVKAPHLNPLKDGDFPVVIITRNISDFDSVSVDHGRGVEIAVDHLVDLGHTNILFVGDKEDEKFEAFKKRILGRGLKFDPDSLIEIKEWLELNSHRAYEQTKKYLFKNELKATAIFVHNDLTAFGVMQALEEQEIKIGKDMALVSFDNTFLASITKPGLTSVSQPTKEIGRIAVEIILNRINKNLEGEPVSISLEPRLVVRESSLGIDLKTLIKETNTNGMVV